MNQRTLKQTLRTLPCSKRFKTDWFFSRSLNLQLSAHDTLLGLWPPVNRVFAAENGIFD
jgi:hypothetical protein